MLHRCGRPGAVCDPRLDLESLEAIEGLGGAPEVCERFDRDRGLHRRKPNFEFGHPFEHRKDQLVRRLVVLERQLEQSEAVNVRPWVSGENLQPERALAKGAGGIDVAAAGGHEGLHTEISSSMLPAQLSGQLRGFLGQRRGRFQFPAAHSTRPSSPSASASRSSSTPGRERGRSREAHAHVMLVGHSRAAPVCRRRRRTG